MTDAPPQAFDEAQRLLDTGDPQAALRLLEPLTGHAEPAVSGAAWVLIGTARYRMDDEAGALEAWQTAADGGGPMAWLGWRSAAEQHVRDGNLQEAIEAYREADRRAPAQERGAIANRIAWLLKETGHDFAARRQFNRARGPYAIYPAYVTWAIIAINVVVFVADLGLGGATNGSILFGTGGRLAEAGLVYQPYVADGEWWRLITSAFIHFGLLHIGFNMFALWLFGPVIEQMYGHLEFAAIYLLCAVGGSVLTILVDPRSAAGGASGAIFGLFGLAFVVSRRRHLLLGPQARAILSQVGMLLVLNLVITFSVSGISWTGHLGGLAVGIALGIALSPTNVPSMGGMWRAPDGRPMARPTSGAFRVLAYATTAALLIAGTLVAVGQVG
jgi:membrane associated rhomboid family serine protease